MKESNQLDNFDMVSNYNMSFATLIRIDNILRMANEATINKNILLHLRSLNALFKETFPFLNDKEKETLSQVHGIINKLVNVSDDKVYFYVKDLNDLDEFELMLRDKLFEKGLLMMKGQDPSFALAGTGGR